VTDLQAIVAVLNAALEHVPVHFRAILTETAQPALAGLEKALAPKPATTAAKSPCD